MPVNVQQSPETQGVARGSAFKGGSVDMDSSGSGDGRPMKNAKPVFGRIVYAFLLSRDVQ
jgi:hypothetical protein